MTANKQAHFESLLRPHLKALYKTAYRFTQSRSDAEDLIQDLLVKTYARLEELSTIERLRPWLAQVLYRLFLDLKRRESRSELQLVIDNDENTLEPTILPEHEPDGMLERSKTQQQLMTALAKLNEDHRIVLTLHDSEGYTLSELVGILECPLGTLKSRLHRARSRMRTLLKREQNHFNDPKILNEK